MFRVRKKTISCLQSRRIEKFKAIDEKVKTQGGPGGCRGEEECRAYCSDTSHFDECAAFAVNEGFLNQKKRSNPFVSSLK